jgi:hypothetical protein
VKELLMSSTFDSIAGRFRPSDGAPGVARLLDEDPDLAGAMTGTRLTEARNRLVARVIERPSGTWPVLGRRPELGFLVLDGVLVRDILIEDTASAELLGPGDLVRSRPTNSPSRLLRTDVRWTVVAPARVAVLGEHSAAALAAYPEVYATLLDRVAERAERLAITQAISQLNGVDRRVLSVLWHLAERWGRVANDGVVLPLPLPHRIIAALVGARRPTVSTALMRLTSDGTVERRGDGTWLLHGDPVGLPTKETARFVPLRRPRGSVAG